MSIKSDIWGTINWGQLSQATDNVALLPDLSGTVIELNAVVFDGAGMFVRAKGAKNCNDLAGSFRLGVPCCDLQDPMAAVLGADSTAIRKTPSVMTRRPGLASACRRHTAKTTCGISPSNTLLTGTA